ncbi:MAG: hypothetical protein R3F54_27275 [Alphaproteobacteria bacterium]
MSSLPPFDEALPMRRLYRNGLKRQEFGGARAPVSQTIGAWFSLGRIVMARIRTHRMGKNGRWQRKINVVAVSMVTSGQRLRRCGDTGFSKL